MSDLDENETIIKQAIVDELKRQRDVEDTGRYGIYFSEDFGTIDGDVDLDRVAKAVMNAVVAAQMGRQ